MEAISHFTTGLQVLKELPDSPERRRQELDLQMALAPALMTIKGYGAPEVEQAYTRAYTLSQQLGETSQLFWVLLGLQSVYLNRAEHNTARSLSEQLLNLSQHQQTPFILPVSPLYDGQLLVLSRTVRCESAALCAGDALL